MAIIVKAHSNDHISYENPILNVGLSALPPLYELVNAKKLLVNDDKAAVKKDKLGVNGGGESNTKG